MKNIDDICRAGLIGLIMTELLMLQLGPMSRLKFEGDLPELGPMMMYIAFAAFDAQMVATFLAMISGLTLLIVWIRRTARPTLLSLGLMVTAILLWGPALVGIVNYT